MSLDWDLKNIKDYEKICIDPLNPDQLSPVTHALIWESMAAGWGWELTEKKVKTAYIRLKALEKLSGEPLEHWEDGKRTTRGFTLKEVQDHIGLRTNASPMTDAEFWKSRSRIHGEACEREMRYEDHSSR